MKLSISNLAWNAAEQKDILPILEEYSVSGIEIAPSKIWSQPSIVSSPQIHTVVSTLKKYQLQVSALQSIFYTEPSFNLFGDTNARNEMFAYFVSMIHLADALYCRSIVFGSPKNKQRGTVGYNEANRIAADFFFRLGEKAKQVDICICLESTPRIYHTDFLTTTREVMEFVSAVNHPFIRLNFDTSALSIVNEDYADTITKAASVIKHVHISETDFGPTHNSTIPHRIVAKSLERIGYADWVSLEMIGINTTSNIERIRSALTFIQSVYQL